MNNIVALTHNVYATFNQPTNYPFAGIDGTDACANMYGADGLVQVGCPLTGGAAYIYKNKFLIDASYPAYNMMVHYALKADGANIGCFDCPIQIV